MCGGYAAWALNTNYWADNRRWIPQLVTGYLEGAPEGMLYSYALHSPLNDAKG
jgi:hypothetical protein